MQKTKQVQAVIFDWAGTIIDYGCMAPVRAFQEAFAGHGIEITSDQARGPMGLHKKDHIRAILQMDAVGAAWKTKHGRDWSADDVESIYTRFLPRQIELAIEHSEPIPGAVELLNSLSEQGIKTGSSTGYTQEIMDQLVPKAEEAGILLDSIVNGTQVSAGRPAPWMIYKNAENLNTYPPCTMIKVGDTLADIHEGLNASIWSVAVVHSSNEMGLSWDEYQKTPRKQVEEKAEEIREKFQKAGPHFIIDSLAELPGVIEEINRRIGEPAACGCYETNCNSGFQDSATQKGHLD